MDIRDLSDERKKKTSAEISHSIHCICGERGLTSKISPLQTLPSVFTSPQIVDAMQEVFAELNYPSFVLPSGAAHDAMIMAEVTDIGMLFVRSRDGISHHPREWSHQKDITLACEILYRTVWKLF